MLLVAGFVPATRDILELELDLKDVEDLLQHKTLVRIILVKMVGLVRCPQLAITPVCVHPISLVQYVKAELIFVHQIHARMAGLVSWAKIHTYVHALHLLRVQDVKRKEMNVVGVSIILLG